MSDALHGQGGDVGRLLVVAGIVAQFDTLESPYQRMIVNAARVMSGIMECRRVTCPYHSHCDDERRAACVMRFKAPELIAPVCQWRVGSGRGERVIGGGVE